MRDFTEEELKEIKRIQARHDKLVPGDVVEIRFRPEYSKISVLITDRIKGKKGGEDTVLCQTSPGHRTRLWPHHLEYGELNN